MNFLRIIIPLHFATALTLGQTAPQKLQAGIPNEPQAFVQSLYQQVMARHPHDIPEGADWTIFSPYFSKALLHRIDLAKSCSADWDRANPDPHLKAQMASTYEPFSGEEGAEPQSFKIEKTQPGKDGSSRVYVRLTDGKPPARSLTWRVAAVVVRENDHFVIDDVIYINDSDYQGTGEIKPPDKQLTGYLSAGCNGPRWIGYSLPNEPETLVHGLYQNVVARKPLDIPYGEDWKVFVPYLSKTLQHRIDVYLACMADWDRQNQGPEVLKPPGLIEFDIFSGSSEEADPHSFQIERTETEKDGSIRVHVRLRWRDAKYVENWHVVDVITREKGRLVLNDVIFLKDPTRADDVDTPLSKLLADGCDGPHWVGYRDH